MLLHLQPHNLHCNSLGDVLHGLRIKKNLASNTKTSMTSKNQKRGMNRKHSTSLIPSAYGSTPATTWTTSNSPKKESLSPIRKITREKEITEGVGQALHATSPLLESLRPDGETDGRNVQPWHDLDPSPTKRDGNAASTSTKAAPPRLWMIPDRSTWPERTERSKELLGKQLY